MFLLRNKKQLDKKNKHSYVPYVCRISYNKQEQSLQIKVFLTLDSFIWQYTNSLSTNK